MFAARAFNQFEGSILGEIGARNIVVMHTLRLCDPNAVKQDRIQNDCCTKCNDSFVHFHVRLLSETLKTHEASSDDIGEMPFCAALSFVSVHPTTRRVVM
jgi:hypothetical protein